MLYRGIISVCTQIHKTYNYNLRAESRIVECRKLVVHRVTARCEVYIEEVTIFTLWSVFKDTHLATGVFIYVHCFWFS